MARRPRRSGCSPRSPRCLTGSRAPSTSARPSPTCSTEEARRSTSALFSGISLCGNPPHGAQVFAALRTTDGNSTLCSGQRKSDPPRTPKGTTMTTEKAARRIAAVGLLTGVLALLATLAAASAQTTERVSVDSAGNEQIGPPPDGPTPPPSISANGRFVAFDSRATNLVSGDTNGRSDVFVHDRQTGITERVSVNSSGNQGNSDSDR